MNYKKISDFIDQQNNLPYEMVVMGAVGLSEYLKNIYVQKNIDIQQFVGDKSVIGLPIEPYIYQNFFLLRKDGEYLLLDGFRRLLQENVPNVDISVNIYDYKFMTDIQLIKLMLGLNHHKFFTTSVNAYTDRGFALLFKSVWGIELAKIVNAINGYSIEKTDYYTDKKPKGAKNYQKIVNSINDFYIKDLQFLQKCQNVNLLVDESFGTQLKKYRLLTDKNFDVLVEVLINDKNLLEQINKLPTARSPSTVHGYIVDLYDRHFTKFVSGIDKELSLAEKQTIYEEQLKKLKKNKNYTQLTVEKNGFDNQRELLKEEIKLAVEQKREIVGVIEPDEKNDLFGVIKLCVNDINTLIYTHDEKRYMVNHTLGKDVRYKQKAMYYNKFHVVGYVEPFYMEKVENGYHVTPTKITVFIQK